MKRLCRRTVRNGSAIPASHEKQIEATPLGSRRSLKNYLVHTNAKPKAYHTVAAKSCELIITAQTGADIQPS